jgi:triphosphoribosyl-dephospho-CoA synthase
VLSAIAARPLAQVAPRSLSWRIARSAVESLYVELSLSPKPGLVCPGDNGSHRDMDAATLMVSLFSLRHYFRAMAAAGFSGAPFRELRRLGVAAEARMLAATRGVNTHRGAIFHLGLIAAAAGHLESRRETVTAPALSHTVRRRWSTAIRDMRPSAPSHGLLVAARHGAGGARLEAVGGFPSVFGLALPCLRAMLARGQEPRRALLHTLFVLIANVDDTNLLYRGGVPGLRFAQDTAKEFVAAGGVLADDWEARACAIRDAFVARNLSPGGSADLLAATWFAHLLTSP